MQTRLGSKQREVMFEIFDKTRQRVEASSKQTLV